MTNRLLTTCLFLLLSLSLLAQVQTQTSRITFGLDEDHLSAFAKTQLAEIAEEATSVDVYKVELYGHTDQQGDVAYNADLAQRRAATVAQTLVELGLSEENVSSASFGESRLLENANSKEAFAKNRRVELVLHTERIQSDDRLFELLAASRTHHEVVNHDTENQIVGDEGVQLSIPANAFTFMDGRTLPTGAQVEVLLEEATKPSSMMAHRLSTNGKGGRLSTGGMVKVTGIYQGKTLRLAENKAIDVEIPTGEFDTEMRLYVGERREDAGMDWELDAGETVEESARITAGNSEKKPTLDADEIALIEEIKAHLVRRDQFIRAMETERLQAYQHPSFPTFKALPSDFNPQAGIPQKPFIPEAPMRKVAQRAGFLSLKGESQRKLDEAFIADSIAYVKQLPAYKAKLDSFADQLARFETNTPDREKVYQTRVEEIVNFRVKQAQTYLKENYTFSVAQSVLSWKEKVETTGPYAKKSLKKLRFDNLVAERGHADADIVIDKALGGSLRHNERFGADTTGFNFEVFRRNFLIDKGLTIPMDSAKVLQRRISHLFSLLRNKRNRVANKQADEINKKLSSSYAFQIRTPVPTWHNCDHPLPEGLYQLLVNKPGTTPTYFYSVKEQTLDYFPAGSRASSTYQGPVALNVLSFGVLDDEGLMLASTATKASRSQRASTILKYQHATLSDIEQALIALDGGPKG